MTDDRPYPEDPDWEGPEGDAARAGEYALGLLPEAERVAFEDRLRVEPNLRRLVAFWEERLVPLADDIPDVAVPPRVWAEVEATLFDARPQRGWWSRLGLVPALAVATLAAVALVVVMLGWPGGPEPRVVAELSGDSRAYVASVAVEDDLQALILVRTTPTPAAGRDHELWLIVGEAAPVSLGVLPRDTDARIVIDPNTAAILDGAILAVSDEPQGGSPTGAPTGEVLALAAVTL
ncbi:anti-sigma factor [Pseudaestuariivita atlantica]|uniref:Anti-sigma K factor RskA C-terminal domain-containing protein n=1 Tax=Pseudaestuariivita atlantica TaxID=1317121 RepID=A0A0L1JTL3_9RHOB|nr:anti-sigma factor [Pseudaestuariivita atlantica]KNG95085.1 hypothetical protein ATO11_00030 [Pseudaestuariivita atlantica]